MALKYKIKGTKIGLRMGQDVLGVVVVDLIIDFFFLALYTSAAIICFDRLERIF